MDIAQCLDELCPAGKYTGSITDNTREAFEALNWADDRPKPDWNMVLERWDDIRTRPPIVGPRGVDVEALAKDVAAMKPEHEDLKKAVPGVLGIAKELKRRQTEDRKRLAGLERDFPETIKANAGLHRETQRILNDLKDQTG